MVKLKILAGLSAALFLSIFSIKTATAAPTTVLSLNKPVFTSSILNNSNSNSGDKITDADNATSKWMSVATDTEWVVIDLGNIQDIYKIRIYWDVASAKNYQVSASTDLSLWIPFADSTRVWPTGTRKDTLYNDGLRVIAARFIRIKCYKRNISSGISLRGVELIGQLLPEFPATLDSKLPISKLYVSSTEGNYVANNMIDTKHDSRWSSLWQNNPNAANQWIAIDLGSPKVVTMISMEFNAAFPKSYEIWALDEGNPFDSTKIMTSTGWFWSLKFPEVVNDVGVGPIYSVCDGKNDLIYSPIRIANYSQPWVMPILNEEKPHRYYAIKFKSPATAYGYSVFNLEVYGQEFMVDVDGNTYRTTKLGTQLWSTQNLRTTRYNDFVPIPNVTDNTAWSNLTTPGYSWYNNTRNQSDGALYNWYAVNSPKLAPKGWHVATEADWAKLSAFLGGDAIAGGPIKTPGTEVWMAPNTGATNYSNFYATPAGYRVWYGVFDGASKYGYWWTLTSYDALNARSRYTDFGNAGLNTNIHDKRSGFPVRCVKN